MYRVLVVDDERIERNGIMLLLKQMKLPCETAQAANGREALKYLEEHGADILLTDVKMPFMDGIELIEELRGRGNNIRCVIFSGCSEFEYARKAVHLGVSDYILKPVDPAEFRKVMTEVMKIVDKQKEQELFWKIGEEHIAGRTHSDGDPAKELLEAVSESTVLKGASPKENAQWRTRAGRREVEAVKRYICEHYGEDISVEKLSEVAYMAPSYLSSVFKKETGQNLSRFIKSVRMERAKQMLEKTMMKIVDISTACGYPNVSYFCSSFREYFGVSPQKFRENAE